MTINHFGNQQTRACILIIDSGSAKFSSINCFSLLANVLRVLAPAMHPCGISSLRALK